VLRVWTIFLFLSAGPTLADTPLLNDEQVKGMRIAADVPAPVAAAFVAALDRGFYTKPAWRSTITLELSKSISAENRFSTAPANLRALGMFLSENLGRTGILNAYLQRVDLGRGCIGVFNAARAYYRATPEQLDILQSVRLAALLQMPERHLNDPSAMAERTLFILRQMRGMETLPDEMQPLPTAIPQYLAELSPRATCKN